MSLNGNFVKIERVIEKVRRDLPGSYSLGIEMAIEWIGEAIPLIGHYGAYTNKTTDGNKELNHEDPAVLENHRAKLPCDIYKLKSVRFITEYDHNLNRVVSSLPMISSSDVFNTSFSKFEYSEMDLRYTLNNSHIYVNGISKGLLNISYDAFIVDERGYPMVPDDERYVRALSAYIQDRVGFRLMMQDKLSERKYNRLEQNWLFYVNSAYTGAMVQTIDEAEAFRNSFTRLVGNSSQHANAYATESSREEGNIHNTTY